MELGIVKLISVRFVLYYYSKKKKVKCYIVVFKGVNFRVKIES